MRRNLIPLLALALGGLPEERAKPRPPRVRVHGPLRDLQRELRVLIYQVRRSPHLHEQMAAVLDEHLAERGLEAGCHTGNRFLTGDSRAEWMAGQFVAICNLPRDRRPPLLVRWFEDAIQHVGEEAPPVKLTPRDTSKLTAEDVRKLAKAEERRERRAAKRAPIPPEVRVVTVDQETPAATKIRGTWIDEPGDVDAPDSHWRKDP